MKKTYKDTYVSFEDGILEIGNSMFRRVWSLKAGAPAVLSVADLKADKEWTWKTPFKDSFRRNDLALNMPPQINIPIGKIKYQYQNADTILTTGQITLSGSDDNNNFSLPWV